MDDSLKLCKFESDPNLAIIYSFVSSYGNVVGFEITFEEFEQFINNYNKVNSKLLNLIVCLLKRWKSNSTLDRFQRQILKFAEIFCFDIYNDLAENGFEKSSAKTKLIVIRALCEVQFDSNKKLKEKILTCSAEEMRLAPSGKDLGGKLYWTFIDNELNLRIFRESDEWSLIVKSRSDLLDLIGKLQEDLANLKTIAALKKEPNSDIKIPEFEINSEIFQSISDPVNTIATVKLTTEVDVKSECKLNNEIYASNLKLSPSNCDIKCNMKFNGLVCDKYIKKEGNETEFDISSNDKDVNKNNENLKTPPNISQSGKRKHIDLSPTCDHSLSDSDNLQSDLSSSDDASPSDKSVDAPPSKRKREKILINRAKRNRMRSDIHDIKICEQSNQIILLDSVPDAIINNSENNDTTLNKIDTVNTDLINKSESINSEKIVTEIDSNILCKTDMILHLDDSIKINEIIKINVFENNNESLNSKSIDSICNIKDQILNKNYLIDQNTRIQINSETKLTNDNTQSNSNENDQNIFISVCECTSPNNLISNNEVSLNHKDLLSKSKDKSINNDLIDEKNLKISKDFINEIDINNQKILSNACINDLNFLSKCEIVSNCDNVEVANFDKEDHIVNSIKIQQSMYNECTQDKFHLKSQIKNESLKCALNINSQIFEQNSTSNFDKLEEDKSNDKLLAAIKNNGLDNLKDVCHSISYYDTLINISNKLNGSYENESGLSNKNCDEKSKNLIDIQTQSLDIHEGYNNCDKNFNEIDNSILLESKNKLNLNYMEKAKLCSRKRSLTADRMSLESKRKNSSSEQINQFIELNDDIKNLNYEEDRLSTESSILNINIIDDDKVNIVSIKRDEYLSNGFSCNRNLSVNESNDSNKSIVSINGCIDLKCSNKTDNLIVNNCESLKNINPPIVYQMDAKSVYNISNSTSSKLKEELNINDDQTIQNNIQSDHLTLVNKNQSNLVSDHLAIENIEVNLQNIEVNLLEKVAVDDDKSNRDLSKCKIEENSFENVNNLQTQKEFCNNSPENTPNCKESVIHKEINTISHNGNIIVAQIDDVIITLNNDVPHSNDDNDCDKHEPSKLNDAKIKLKGRPRKRKTEIHILENESSLDHTKFEPRRSSRANKGQRLIDSSLVSFNKKANKQINAESNNEYASSKENEKVHAGRKKRKNKKDKDFLPSNDTSTKKQKGRHYRKGKKGDITTSDDQDYNQDFYDDDLDDLEYEEDEPLRFSSESLSEAESNGSLYVPHGRNAIRSAAISAKELEVDDNKPCLSCQRTNNPEMILLCDKCDGGYHMTCLSPLLHYVPDGDWFCPTCQHVMLIDKLKECLVDFDKREKENCRIVQRKQRLAFVGISLTNILQKRNDEKKAYIDKYKMSSDEENQNNEITKDHKQHYRRPKNKYQRKYNRRDSFSESDERGSSTNESDESNIFINKSGGSRLKSENSHKRILTYSQSKNTKSNYGNRSNKSRSWNDKSELNRSNVDDSYSMERSCRQRTKINYKFEEFDQLIKQAVGDEHKQRQAEVKELVSRGKEINNCLSTNRKKKKKFSQLDSSDSEEEAIDDVDEFNIEEQVSTDDEDASDEEAADDDASLSDDSISKQERNGRWRKMDVSRRRKRRVHLDDEDSLSLQSSTEESESCVREAARRRINYTELSDHSNHSLLNDATNVRKYKRSNKCHSNSNESDYEPSDIEKSLEPDEKDASIIDKNSINEDSNIESESNSNSISGKKRKIVSRKVIDDDDDNDEF